MGKLKTKFKKKQTTNTQVEVSKIAMILFKASQSLSKEVSSFISKYFQRYSCIIK